MALSGRDRGHLSGRPRLPDGVLDDQVGGPDPISWRDVIAAFERVHGRTLEVEDLPLGAPMPGFPPAGAGLISALETYDSPEPLLPEEAKRRSALSSRGSKKFCAERPPRPTRLRSFVRLSNSATLNCFICDSP